MNTNPIEELRHLEAPVTEQEWSAILQDKRYTQKFGRKSGLSPKGRAAFIIGVVITIIAIPILVKTLSHESTTPVLEATDGAKNIVSQEITSSNAPNATSTTATLPNSQIIPSTPIKVENTAGAANQEHTTMTSVVAARAQNPVAEQPSGIPAIASPTVKPSLTVPTTPSEVNTSTPVVRPTPTTNPQRTDAENIAEVVESKSETESTPEENETEQFFIPSAFTPNGDGLNDLFFVKANFEPRNFEMTIMTRNGDLLFHSRDINIGWDGQLHGSTLPNGMYVYIIKYKDREGKDQKQQGQILLIP